MQITVPRNIVEQVIEDYDFDSVTAIADELCNSPAMNAYAAELLTSENPVESILWAISLGFQAGRSGRLSPLKLVPGGTAPVIQFPTAH